MKFIIDLALNASALALAIIAIAKLIALLIRLMEM
jgi:hypothetical protein